jgi:hypothetical protein
MNEGPSVLESPLASNRLYTTASTHTRAGSNKTFETQPRYLPVLVSPDRRQYRKRDNAMHNRVY